VTLAWIARSRCWRTQKPGPGRSRRLPRLQKSKFRKSACACVCGMLVLGGSFEMDWLLIAILIAAVGAHLIVAGFGR
jgi:hypothetical protein